MDFGGFAKLRYTLRYTGAAASSRSKANFLRPCARGLTMPPLVQPGGCHETHDACDCVRDGGGMSPESKLGGVYMEHESRLRVAPTGADTFAMTIEKISTR